MDSDDRKETMKTRDATPPHVGPISLKVALIYAVLGGLWILISDLALSSLIKDPVTLTRVGILKEWLFIGITAFMLYLLIKRTFGSIRKSEEDLRQIVFGLLLILAMRFRPKGLVGKYAFE